jgi:hypothetical protein
MRVIIIRLWPLKAKGLADIGRMKHEILLICLLARAVKGATSRAHAQTRLRAAFVSQKGLHRMNLIALITIDIKAFYEDYHAAELVGT